MSLEISIVIPVYNEAKVINRTIKTIKNYLELHSFNYEIIVVDDGSKDGTDGILLALSKEVEGLKVIKHSTNEGKGKAVTDGVLTASFDPILFTDADLSARIENLDKMISKLKEGYDIVIGSRYVKDAITKNRTLQRRLMGKIFNILVKMLGLTKFNDTQCGFKLFRRKAAQDIFTRLTIFGYAFDVEVLYIADKLNYKVYECPILWVDNPDSKIKLVRDSIKMLKEVFNIYKGIRS